VGESQEKERNAQSMAYESEYLFKLGQHYQDILNKQKSVIRQNRITDLIIEETSSVSDSAINSHQQQYNKDFFKPPSSIMGSRVIGGGTANGGLDLNESQFNQDF
jgi:hypothetical protein